MELNKPANIWDYVNLKESECMSEVCMLTDIWKPFMAMGQIYYFLIRPVITS